MVDYEKIQNGMILGEEYMKKIIIYGKQKNYVIQNIQTKC